LRFITPLADRLLSMVVPAMSAGACCPPDPYQVACGPCYKNRLTEHQSQKTCTYTCACKVHCGGCSNYTTCV
jgi:hypothetical protein